MATANSFSIKMIRNYIVFGFKNFYSDFVIEGEENIPTSGPVIFAPNHTNALMDALAIHAITPAKLPLTFLARADIFKNKKLAAVLHYLGILPAFRMRDGVENLAKNQETFAKCVELLRTNGGLGIMPEGNQDLERKIRPLGKGIFRIAFAAQESFSDQPFVKIVPVGIDYGHLSKFGKHILISIGKPIEVAEYMNDYTQNAVNATNEIRKRLYNELNELTVNIVSEKYYQCIQTTIEVVTAVEMTGYEISSPTLARFEAERRITARLLAMEKKNPSEMEELDELCIDYTNAIKLNNLYSTTLDQVPFKFFSMIKQGTWLLITSPFFFLGYILNFLPFFTPVYIRKKLNVNYEGFFSSIHFSLGLVCFPLFYVLQTLLINAAYNITWVEMILSCVLQLLLGKGAFSWYTSFRKLKASLEYRMMAQKHPTVVNRIMKLREKIINFVKN